MNQNPSRTVLFALLGGFTLGALTLALTTPKTGKEVRDQFRAIGSWLRNQPEEEDAEVDGSVRTLFV
jgi:hypothetical protein